MDFMKVFGVFLVIVGHLPLVNDDVMKFVFSFHMPLFFICSGYLFREKDMNRSFIMKNVKQLLLVMIPFFLIVVIFNLFQNGLFYRDKFTVEAIIISPLKYLLTGNSRIGWMWFLWALFWMRLSYNLLCNMTKNKYKHYYIFLLSLVCGYCLYYSNVRLNYYQFSAFIFCMPFFCFGQILSKLRFHEHVKGKKSIGLIFVLCAMYVILFSCCGKINMNALNVGNDYTTYLLVGFVANVLFMTIFDNISVREKLLNVIVVISNGTLVYLCFHGMLIQMFKIAYKKVMHINLPPRIWIRFPGLLSHSAL